FCCKVKGHKGLAKVGGAGFVSWVLALHGGRTCRRRGAEFDWPATVRRSSRFLCRWSMPLKWPRRIGCQCRGCADRALHSWHHVFVIGIGFVGSSRPGNRRHDAGSYAGRTMGAHPRWLGVFFFVAERRSWSAAASSTRRGGGAGAHLGAGFG